MKREQLGELRELEGHKVFANGQDVFVGRDHVVEVWEAATGRRRPAA